MAAASHRASAWTAGCALAVVLMCMSMLTASACPDSFASLRSPFVRDHLDHAKLNGLWYEQAYHDVAQIGNSCQRFNKTFVANENGVHEDFKVLYGKLPFTVKVFYNITADAGVFIRNAFGAPLYFHSVILDIVTNADGDYVAISEFTCQKIAGIDYVELRFATRGDAADSSVVAPLEERATSLGLKYALKNVDHTFCPSSL
eukprot:Opistho-2@19494